MGLLSAQAVRRLIYIFRMAAFSRAPAQLSPIEEKKSRLTLLFAPPCKLPIRMAEVESKQKKSAR